ncbi:PEP-CTERM sorting domain-containing protein [Methyloversatilis sp.]|uniref:PEP-CTERM sorting domain-containing protein n=1 Tax=Methyloversatilis sp. TaxID=2569862 RepID=UPI002732F753|nr:PEP-CTERM sorting domain-containing protein [Methyloversatilis sp.]MDP2870199.1 PEP-CTERM sorting domain-containing protein [Methyloversatilis sp.]MDP3454837.1 PEP-CTERM sorting domain-containing protein [Methyloversatilis sp.]MDP3577005.1 PEP-CTERM sorting domain-containing protein [Methyloversatilis sp.]
MKFPSLLGLATLGVALSFPAAAGLNGDIVTTALHAETADYGRFSAVVGAGVEGSLVGGRLPFDYSDSGFSLSSPGNFCGIRSCGDAREQMTLKLSGLEFGPSVVLKDIVLVTILSNVTVTVGPTFAEFSWTDQSISPGAFLSAQFVTGVVPEPEALTLMLAGLGLIGIAASRRSQRA